MSASAFLGAVQDKVSAQALAELGTLIDKTETLLKKEMSSDIHTVEGCGNQTLLGGGKRLRPALAIASAGVCGEINSDSIIGVAAALEMIHMATLIHDDVIDGAITRRGLPTASAIHGNNAAVLSGDVLLAKAMRLLAEHSDLDIIRMVSQSVVELAEGEVFELECRGNIDLTVAEHLRVLDLKTATFIASCCKTGARLQGAPHAIEIALGNYGRNLGIAFQLVDDVLDYKGEQEKTGKPRATDFRDGQATWPLITLLPLLNESESDRVRSSFGTLCDDREIEWLVALMDEYETLKLTHAKAREHVDLAICAIAPLGDSEYGALLETVATFVVEREA